MIITCPFCGNEHEFKPPVNIICSCGSKFYANTHEWLNRKTGEKLKCHFEVKYIIDQPAKMENVN